MDLTLYLQTTDTFDFAPSSRVLLDNGFLRVTGKAARTGVYQYLASELGLTDRPANDVVNVLRSPEEVFNADSLATYSHADVTNDHPITMVDAKTFKQVSAGHVVSATQNGDFVDVEMIIKDAKAIEDVQSGKAQLSPGYTTTYEPCEGTYDATGEKYEFKQTDIKVNHVAIVKRGRGGEQVRINDNHGVKTMNQVTLDAGRSIEIEDAAIAALVNDSTERFKKQVEDAQTALGKVEAERDALDEKLEAAEALTTDAAIAARVEAIATVQDQARKIAGESFKCTSVDTMTIKREALTAVRDSIVWADKNDSYVDAAFDMSFADADKPAATNTNTNDQLAQFSKDAANVVVNQEPVKSAYDSHKDNLSNAWKGK